MFKLRLDAEDRKRLDAIAAHYSAPAATALRMLIKREHDRLQAQHGAALTREHLAVLRALEDEGGPLEQGEIVSDLQKDYGYRDVKWLGSVLRDLRRDGYIQRLAGGSYSPTSKALAAVKK